MWKCQLLSDWLIPASFQAGPGERRKKKRRRKERKRENIRMIFHKMHLTLFAAKYFLCPQCALPLSSSSSSFFLPPSPEYQPISRKLAFPKGALLVSQTKTNLPSPECYSPIGEFETSVWRSANHTRNRARECYIAVACEMGGGMTSELVYTFPLNVAKSGTRRSNGEVS